MQLLKAYGCELWDAMQTLKKNKLVKKIGYSVYTPSELDLLWDDFQPDIIQSPFNILDQRLKTSGWLKRLHNNGVEVHARSIFLQGLLLMKKEDRPEKFSQWNKIWQEWGSWLEEEKMSPLEGTLGFINSESMIDRSVVGVDSLKQLKEIIACPELQIKDIPTEITTTDQNLINPVNWSKL